MTSHRSGDIARARKKGGLKFLYSFERLSWIENRVISLGEKPIPELNKLEAGIVLFGHNWNDDQVLKTQKQNFEWFGWKTPEALSFNWQYTKDADDESPKSYSDAVAEFAVLLQLALPRESAHPAFEGEPGSESMKNKEEM